ncbi:GNAT family N-acetyltransferase [Marinobacter sp. DY40_1A1]|uniref:GNAT family N-acetyltransferase n=1 Tax=Marinobacter sp. DY40_1A1 TaxID=2583229 RepID=UPI001908C3E9|nr:GNAT family N-acetyltransferase [Marinobacter sp. DY40_1A1]MBK1885599.1 GNAT family N-acetyltransferase [Marinobacter sp. DY40_1A1]
MAELIEFETERLFLRQWQESDFKSFATLNADPKVMEYFPEPLSGQASTEMAEKIHSLIKQRGWGFWAVEVKDAEPFIGFCGLHVPTATLPFSPCVEIGWRLSSAHWGKGYASEAARGALGVAFQHLELPEIVSFTTVGNQRSRRVMERIGMKYSGEFEHPSLPKGSLLRSHVLYRLRREQWDAKA